MEQALPLVSIIITSYNRENTIAKAIESALAQDYPNLEIIISDNCSTDGSHKIITQYSYDPRIHYTINEVNLGMIKNFKNSIFDKAKGKYFSIVNSDDEYINTNFISKAIEIILKYENVILVKGGSLHRRKDAGKYHIYKNNKEYTIGLDYFKSFSFHEDFGWAGVLIERKYVKDYSLLNNNLIGADYFINLRLALLGNIGFIKTPCYQFNLHDSNASVGSYSIEQIDGIFNELNTLFNFAIKNNAYKEEDLANIKANYDQCYVANIIEDYYRHNRANLKIVEKKLRYYTPSMVDKYYKSNRWKLFRTTFYFPKIGRLLESVNWRRKNFLNKIVSMLPK